MTAESPGSGRLRCLLTHLAVFVLYLYMPVLPLAAALGWLSTRGIGAFVASLVASAVGFLGLGVLVAMWLAYEEDWWDDFREQNRALVAFGLLHVIGIPMAWIAGRALGG